MTDRSGAGRKHDGNTRIAWHPAFVGAMRLELDQYADALEFVPEYQLTSEPLQIDVLIIKKAGDIRLEKNIAAIFRKDNILEYKSPEDYLSVEDFYKVYGYACLYTALNKVPVTDLTLTFVESRHPRKLLGHLREVRGYRVEEPWSGIYHISGDIIPMQIIESKKLPEGNLWLRDLTNDLDAGQFNRVLHESSQKEKDALILAYIRAILEANSGKLPEVLAMGSAAMSLDEVLESTGLAAKWEARGEARGEIWGEIRGEARGKALGEQKKALEIARNLLKRGWSVEETAETAALDIKKVRTLYESLHI